ncbi:hypothetical protein [Haloarcula sp. Atlit-120R]|uniref:hypothetical protein n=1 Tax=Haloarcula sp. Atlit-120R TaxID=2282135 RepID=UPI000EF1BF7E|nr:hypothetical protein [Haloarcula sp. Atlit-120R]
MPSRRSYLTGLATAGVVGFAGCSDGSDRVTGTVFRKSVHAAHSTQQEDTDWTLIAFMAGGVHDQTVLIKYDPTYLTVDTDAVEMTLTDEQQKLLERDFGGVELSFAVVPEGADGGPVRQARRPAFNEVRVGGEATVSAFTGDDGARYHRLHETGPRPAELSISQLTRIRTDEASQ